MGGSIKIKVFDYFEDKDAFKVRKSFQYVVEQLGLREWTPVVFIGRLFCMDNDFGEHWFDNWEFRGRQNLGEEWHVIEPDRFQDGKDGPCHSRELRHHFWTNVLENLTVDLEFLFEAAREHHLKWGVLKPEELEKRIQAILTLRFIKSGTAYDIETPESLGMEPDDEE